VSLNHSPHAGLSATKSLVFDILTVIHHSAGNQRRSYVQEIEASASHK